MSLDLSTLSLLQIVILLFALTALDWVAGVGGAIAHKTFSVNQVADFLASHVLSRVIPLIFAAAVGQGVPQIGLAAVPAVWALFLAGGAAYLAETVASISASLHD